jgi:hypothetical protein
VYGLAVDDDDDDDVIDVIIGNRKNFSLQK